MDGMDTQWSVIPSVNDPTKIFHIQSVHSLYNCPNSFLHYDVCSKIGDSVFGIAGAEYQEHSIELRTDAGWKFE